ncbi:MAG: flagellar hook-length control protein FliK, partial [Candidatus Desantisbacteria bacterium]
VEQATTSQAQPASIAPAAVATIEQAATSQIQPASIAPAATIDRIESMPVVVNQTQQDTIKTTVFVDAGFTAKKQSRLDTIDSSSMNQEMEIMNKIKEGIERILFKDGDSTDLNMNMKNEQSGTFFNTHEEHLIKETSVPWQNLSDSAKEIINRLVAEIKINLKDEITQMHIQLKPEHLGKLEFILSMEEETLTATFLVQDAYVKELIGSNLEILRNALEMSKINVGLINVFVRDEHLGNRQKREDVLSPISRVLKEKKQQINIDNISRLGMRDTINFVA